MYDWRNMSDTQREEVVCVRRQQGQPWHGPPHGLEKNWYHISAACYEHAPIVGYSPERMTGFEKALHIALAPVTEIISAWCILPNHYHLLVQAMNLSACRKALGLLHGRTSHEWNLKEEISSRKCWHRCLPKAVKSERHRWATMNYIHHNPVHHGYVEKWQDWVFSSAGSFLKEVGREKAVAIWNEYPLLDFGDGWDDCDL